MPKFLKGHHSRHNDWASKSPPDVPSGLCECGCGGTTPICAYPRPDRRQYTGHPLPLIPGHRRPEPNDHIRTLTSTEAAYLAGIVDGEGCIHQAKNNGRNVRITVANTDVYLIDWLRNIGGTVTANRHRFKPSQKSTKTVYAWQAGSWRTANDLLKQIFPFMIIKRAKAEAALKDLAQWLTEPRYPRKTHCIKGHEFTATNTGYAKRDGTQVCRACRRDGTRRARSTMVTTSPDQQTHQ